MDTGLEEIYLHHSYFKGRLTEVECLGHTNNTGGNGAGKTTLLSLIPVFYGMEPSKVVDRSAGKLSFLDHYLPTSKSMIVFEYCKIGSKKCVVLYRNKDTIAYRFVDASANEALFNQNILDALQECESIKQWLREVVSNSSDVSKQISTSIDYRSIIQNDKQRLRVKRKAQGSLVSLAHQYSLCSSNTQMRHIESLASVLMRHDKLLAQFKLMVVDSFLTDQIEIGEAPYHKEDTEYVSSVQTLIELDKHKEKFSESIAQYEALKEAWAYLLAYQKRLKNELVFISKNKDEIDVQQAQLKTEKVELHRTNKEHLSALNNTFSDKSNKALIKKNLIDTIYDDREKWDSEVDIASKVSEYDRLNELKFKAEKDQKHFVTLLESVNTEKQAHEGVVSSQEKEASQQELAITQQINKLNNKLHQFELDTQRKEQVRSEECNQKVSTVRLKREKESKVLLEVVHELKLQLQQASSYTEKEESELNNLISKIAEFNGYIINELAVKQKSTQVDITEKIKERARLFEQRDKKNQKLEKKQNERATITRQLQPEDGTVRSFLNENLNNWRSSIGKVIRPELLTLKTLSPLIINETDNLSLYGLALNLENVSLPAEAESDEVLSQMREELGRDIDNLKKEIKVLDVKISTINIEVQELGFEADKQGREESRCKEDISKFELLKSSIQRGFEAEITRRKHYLEDKVNTALSSVKLFDAETITLESNLKKSYQSDLIAFKANASAERSSLEETIAAKKNSISTLRSDLKKCLADLEEAFNCILKEKDIDPKTIEAAKQRKDDSESKYSEVKNYSKTIMEFKSWEAAQWTKIEQYEIEFSALTEESSRLESELKHLAEKYQKIESDLDEKMKSISTQMENLEKTSRSINTALDDIDFHAQFVPIDQQSIELDNATPFELVIQSARENITCIKKLRQQIGLAVRKVGEILLATGTANNKVLHIWKSMEEERIAVSSYEKLSEDFSIESVQDVRRLIEISIPDISAVILESIKTVGERYIRFYQALDGLKSKVRNVSSKLVKEINTANNFPALSDIKVELVSKVDEFDLWKELRNFSEVWSRWGELGRDILPDKEFVTSFSSVISELKQSKIGSTIESLVDIDISMTENGRAVNIRTDADLKKISSTGISKLAVIVVFCGMTRYLCKDKNVTIHWPLDELGELSNENVMLLFEFMDQNNISLFCAQPNPSVVLLRYFTTKNHVDKNLGIKKYISRQSSRKNPLLSKRTTEFQGEEVNV